MTTVTPDMPVIVFGVKDGRIVPQDQCGSDYALPGGSFANLAEAQKVFSDLSLDCTDNPRFAGPVLENRQGRAWSRFDSREHYNWVMRD